MTFQFSKRQKFVSKCLYFSFLLLHYQLFFFIFLTCIIGEQTLTLSTHFCISSILNPKPIKTPPTQNPKIQSLAPLFSHHWIKTAPISPKPKTLLSTLLCNCNSFPNNKKPKPQITKNPRISKFLFLFLLLLHPSNPPPPNTFQNQKPPPFPSPPPISAMTKSKGCGKILSLEAMVVINWSINLVDLWDPFLLLLLLAHITGVWTFLV